MLAKDVSRKNGPTLTWHATCATWRAPPCLRTDDGLARTRAGSSTFSGGTHRRIGLGTGSAGPRAPGLGGTRGVYHPAMQRVATCPLAFPLAFPLVWAISVSSFSPPAISQQGPPGAMPALIDRYRTDLQDLERFYFIVSSARRDERLQAFEEEWRARLDGVDFEGLSQAGKVDYLLLRNELAEQRRTRELERERRAELAPLFPFAESIVALEETRWGVTEIDARTVASEVAALAQEVETLASDLHPLEELNEDDDRGGLFVSPVGALRAARTTRDLSRAIDSWYENYAAYHPSFAWWVEEPYASLNDALDQYAATLRTAIAGIRGEDDDPLIGNPLGQEAVRAAVRGELLAYSPEELLAIGRREFEWCEEQMKVASRELGHGDDWQAALEAVKGMHVDPGEQDRLIADQARAAIRWVDERELVTIEPLCRELWRLEMLDRRGQRTLPFAAYGGQKMLVAYPPPTWITRPS